MQITKIPFKQIIPKQDQPRKRISGITGLAVNIKKNGLINPISVERIAADKFEVISGERRYLAMCFLKWRKIPCIIRKRTKWDSLAENFCREDLNIVEKAQAIHKLLVSDFGQRYPQMLITLKNTDKTEWTPTEIKLQESCDAIGYTPLYIYQISKVLKIDTKIQDRIIQKNVGSAVAIKLSTIKSVEIQTKILKLIEAGESDTAIIKVINAEKFLETKMASHSIEKMREVFLAWQNFTRGSSHLKSSIPLLIGAIENLNISKKKTIVKNTEALKYLLNKLTEKKFRIAAQNCLRLVEKLSEEVIED